MAAALSPARLLSVGLAFAVVLSGCIGSPTSLQPASTGDLVGSILGAVKVREEGGFEVDVPIHVYMLGFDAATVDAVQAKLEPTPIDHSPFSFDRAFPPDPSATPLGGPSFQSPSQPRAVFMVHDLDAAFESAFLTAAKGWGPNEGRIPTYDANAAEAYLARELKADDRNAPVFVVMHDGGALGEHGWRYTFSHGYLDPIRIFGELLPVTVFDVSAQPDPYVVSDPSSPMGIVFASVFGPSPEQPYDRPIEPSGDKTVEVLKTLIVDAAHWRFLKGPIYPITTKPCHHVTLLLAVDQTSITEAAPGMPKAQDWVDVPGLQSAFVNLTGDPVTVELKTYTLPQDEPALAALVRGAGSFATLDALRWYLDENFEKFVTLAPDCEEYLSVMYYGDPGAAGAFGGIGTYDVKRSHRISFSLVSDVSRIRSNYEGPGQEVLRTRDESRVAYNMINLLYSHETGHLFGQHHPQHLAKTGDAAGSVTNHAFEGVYSVMSYQTDDKTIDFGAVDYATWNRGRAGYTIADAQAMKLEGTPEFASALDHLARGHWAMAHHALSEKLHDAMGSHTHDHALADYDIGDYHFHDWS